MGQDLKNKQERVRSKNQENEITDEINKNNDELSTIMSRSQCSTCVSYVCKVCGENINRGGGQTSTAGAETCYSCSIYEGNSSIVSSHVSSCNSECSSKATHTDTWKRNSSKDRGNYTSSEDGGSIRSRRSVQIIPTDSESSLTGSDSDESILGDLDSPQTGMPAFKSSK